MKIFTSIKFKLTFWYSSLVFVICVLFLGFANIILTQQLSNTPAESPTVPFIRNRPLLQEQWEMLDEERKDLVQQYRKEDLKKFRQTSIMTLLPLTALSFLGGYLIAEQSLSPLKKLNRQIRDITAENLNSQIKHKNKGDEISEIIENFNTMTSRLDKSFQAQKQFIEDASHELKTPLAIIQTNLDAAKLDKKITSSEASSLIETAQKSGEFMNKLIEDLLLLSLLENNIEKKPIDLGNIISETISSIRHIAKGQNIKITFKKPAKKITIPANAILLQRAFGNLIENAIKYSPRNSKITIDVESKKHKIIISFSDTGPGIPKKEQKKIFERFYRLDKSRSRKTGGTGLGLSIVRKIVEAHGGEISIESTPGRGSKFILAFEI
ncbi:GHKL domain-containing protein [Candidatus Dojkabacteria bacterium]|nr:GHKL domain-containing protein [Candidatus Dojkabacteria bacterium]